MNNFKPRGNSSDDAIERSAEDAELRFAAPLHHFGAKFDGGFGAYEGKCLCLAFLLATGPAETDIRGTASWYLIIG